MSALMRSWTQARMKIDVKPVMIIGGGLIDFDDVSVVDGFWSAGCRG